MFMLETLRTDCAHSKFISEIIQRDESLKGIESKLDSPNNLACTDGHGRSGFFLWSVFIDKITSDMESIMWLLQRKIFLKIIIIIAPIIPQPAGLNALPHQKVPFPSVTLQSPLYTVHYSKWCYTILY